MESEGKVDKKKIEDSTPFERKELKESDFKPHGELEIGYMEELWAKPRKSMEDKVAEITEEIGHRTPEGNIIRKDTEAREREIREREPRETKERGDLAAREIETSKRKLREKKTGKKEAR